VLLDIVMPGLDGFEVCRRLKADPATTSIPVLIVTSLTDRDDRLEGIGAGATDFISKPVDEQEVLLRVRNALQAKRLLDTVTENLAHQQVLYGELQVKNEELVDFAHIVSHDLKSPLCSLTAILSLVKDRRWVSGDGAELVDDGINACREMSSFITCVLELSLAGKIVVERIPVDVQALVGPLFEMIRPAEVRASLVLERELPAVMGDPVRLKQVFQNLISNAFSYRDPEKEELVITVRYEERPEELLFAVSDNGSGIPAEVVPRIFDIGYSRSKKGKKASTGFGLAITRKIVEAHGGRIWVESEGPGSGTTFLFTIAGKI